MWKWPILALALIACSGGDELEAPMLGDCSHCGTAPISGGEISGGSDASPGFDASPTFDAANAFDALDIVDVGAPSDFDAPFDL